MKNCSPARVAKYKGIRKPTCNNGKGCDACWHKYHVNLHQSFENLADDTMAILKTYGITGVIFK